jgi:hypothetical protein
VLTLHERLGITVNREGMGHGCGSLVIERNPRHSATLVPAFFYYQSTCFSGVWRA